MPRLMLSDELWPKLLGILLQMNVYYKKGIRKTVEGILFRIRTGLPWRDLPSAFGHWNSVYKKFNAWSRKGIWKRLLDALVIEPDLEWIFIDGSYVKAHQHSAGAAGGNPESIGVSRAGRTSKIHLLVDAFGLPYGFTLTGGEIHDATAAPDLIEKIAGGNTVIADKGYDSEKIRTQIEANDMTSVIPRRKNSKRGNEGFDWHLYKYRHLVENAFARLKHFRGVATRYDKLARNYESVVALACAFIWLPM